MRALTRLARIHKEIASNDFPSIGTLAEILEVTERTIIRGLVVLKNEMNAPIKFDRKKKGFYYVTNEWSLPLERISYDDLMSFA